MLAHSVVDSKPRIQSTRKTGDACNKCNNGPPQHSEREREKGKEPGSNFERGTKMRGMAKEKEGGKEGRGREGTGNCTELAASQPGSPHLRIFALCINSLLTMIKQEGILLQCKLWFT